MKAENKTVSATLVLSATFYHLAGKDWGTDGSESFVSIADQRWGRIFKQRSTADKKRSKNSN